MPGGNERIGNTSLGLNLGNKLGWKEEKLVELVGAQAAASLLEQIGKYTDPDFDIRSTFVSIDFSGGSLRQTDISVWELNENGSVTSLAEVSRDNYAYLLNKDDNYYLAVPISDSIEKLIYISYDI